MNELNRPDDEFVKGKHHIGCLNDLTANCLCMKCAKDDSAKGTTNDVCCIRHFGRNCVWNRDNQCPDFEPESVERSDKLLKKAEFPNDTKQICLSRKLPRKLP